MRHPVSNFSSIIKKHFPDFEFLNKENKREVVRNFMTVFMDGYKELSDEKKKALEGQIFKFYGIVEKTTSQRIDEAVGSLRTEIDDLKGKVKSFSDKHESGVKLLSKEISKDRLKALNDRVSQIEKAIKKNESLFNSAIKTISKEIEKNKITGWEEKIDDLKALISGKDNSGEIISALSSQIEKSKPVDLNTRIDALRGEQAVGISEIGSKINEIAEKVSSEPTNWKFTVKRDERDLVTGLEAKRE